MSANNFYTHYAGACWAKRSGIIVPCGTRSLTFFSHHLIGDNFLCVVLDLVDFFLIKTDSKTKTKKDVKTMKRSQHAEHCRQVLGEPFPQVHDFLDQYYDKLGPGHRTIFHNATGVLYCYQEWGPMAAAAACIHIHDDEVGMMQCEDGTFKPVPIIGKEQ